MSEPLGKRSTPDRDAPSEWADDLSQPVHIELEPLDTEPLPQRTVGQFPDARTESGQDTYAVPERPLHLCPNCDYNLTGLTSRRCPECGEPFTLHDARMRGIDTSDAVRGLRVRVRWGQVRVGIGLALMTLAFVAANSLRLSGLTGSTFGPLNRFTFPGVFILIVIGGLLMFIAFWKYYFELAWPNLILGIGIIVAILATLFIL